MSDPIREAYIELGAKVNLKPGFDSAKKETRQATQSIQQDANAITRSLDEVVYHPFFSGAGSAIAKPIIASIVQKTFQNIAAPRINPEVPSFQLQPSSHVDYGNTTKTGELSRDQIRSLYTGQETKQISKADLIGAMSYSQFQKRQEDRWNASRFGELRQLAQSRRDLPFLEFSTRSALTNPNDPNHPDSPAYKVRSEQIRNSALGERIGKYGSALAVGLGGAYAAERFVMSTASKGAPLSVGRLDQSVNDLQAVIGRQFAPLLEDVTGVVRGFADRQASMPPAQQKVSAYGAAALTGVAGIAAVQFGLKALESHSVGGGLAGVAANAKSVAKFLINPRFGLLAGAALAADSIFFEGTGRKAAINSFFGDKDQSSFGAAGLGVSFGETGTSIRDILNEQGVTSAGAPMTAAQQEKERKDTLEPLGFFGRRNQYWLDLYHEVAHDLWGGQDYSTQNEQLKKARVGG